MYADEALTPALRRDAIFRWSLAAADALGAAIAGIVAVGGDLRLPALGLVALLILAAKTMSLYDRDQVLICKRTLDEAPGLFHLSTLIALVFWLGHSAFSTTPVDAGTVLVGWASLFGALLVSRTLARRFAQAATPEERCLIVAESHDHARLSERLEADRRLKANVVGHLPLVERRSESRAAPHTALERLVRSLDVHRVVIAPDGVEPSTVLDVVSRATSLGLNVSVLPRICEVVGSSVEFDDLGGVTLLGVRPFRLSRSSRVIKRAVDLAGAGLALLVGAPFLALMALAIKLDSRGPVLYRQTRVGKDGDPFVMLKFRTMVDGAHAQRAALAHLSSGNGLFKVARDPRITRVGRLLRKASLDELPQLLNVLRGEMSLVGPRPLVVEEDKLVLGRHRRRLHLKPGLTGPWQVLGSADVRVGVEDMATIDYLYVVNWSLWADIQVVLRTVAHVLAGRGV